MRISDATEQWVFTGHRQPQCKKWQSDEATRWRTEATAVGRACTCTQGSDTLRCVACLNDLHIQLLGCLFGQHRCAQRALCSLSTRCARGAAHEGALKRILLPALPIL